MEAWRRAGFLGQEEAALRGPEGCSWDSPERKGADYWRSELPLALLSPPTSVQFRGRSAKPGLGSGDRGHKFLAVLLGTWRTPLAAAPVGKGQKAVAPEREVASGGQESPATSKMRVHIPACLALACVFPNSGSPISSSSYSEVQAIVPPPIPWHPA